MKVSIIIPLYNEETNITPLYEKVKLSHVDVSYDYEILFIDDGSTDMTSKILIPLIEKDKTTKLIRFKHNFGQTSAMMAGIDYSSGDIIVPMDGDLQNDPNDIPKLIEKIDAGYDVCSGWRKNRKDNLFWKKVPSWFANKLISKISGVRLNDYGCTLKAYRRDVLEGVRLYGEMHRFIPIYAHWQGAKITEIPVVHHSRIYGKSNYGLERIFKVLLDLMLLRFFTTLASKPIYLFGGFGIVSIIFSFLTFCLMVYYKYFGDKSFIETPLPQVFVLFFLIGFVSILMGFMSEISMRTYYESQDKKSYAVMETYNLKDEN